MITHARKLFLSWTSALAALVACDFSPPAFAQASDEGPECFDLAVVAQVTRQDYEPIPDLGPDYIVMRWPWTLDLQVQEVVHGSVASDRLRVTMVLHNNLRSDVDQMLFFMRRMEDGGYLVTSTEWRIVPDRRGRFVLLFAEPADTDWLYPNRWIDADYADLLRPVSYSPSQAAGLSRERWDDHELEALAPEWATIEDNYVVAHRGIPVRDLVDHALTLPGARCEGAA